MARAKKKVSCQDCDRTFSRKGELQQHRREEHSRKNMCPICKRAFESEKRLKMHSQFHNVGGEYKCFYCPKQFNKAWKMKIHLVNHSGRPSYICEYCGDDFLYPGKIVMHLKLVHDVCYACKDCGHAIPIEHSQESHKCKIYGCKDCLLSFATEAELAEHVDTYAGKCSPPEESDQSLPPEDMRQQYEGYLSIQDSTPQEDSLSDGREKNGGCESPEAPLVVVEDTYPTKTTGVKRHQGKNRVTGASQQFSNVASNGMHDGCNKRDIPSHSASEESCKARLQDAEVNDRQRDVLVSPSSPSTPIKYLVPKLSDGTRDGMSEWTLVVQERHGTVNNSVIGDVKEEVEGVDVEEGKEGEPPSYFSSILLRSPSRDLSCGFKVPDTGTGMWKKVETPISRSLRRKQDELDKAVKKREVLNTLQLYVDTDARLTQRSQTSLKSWLTGDSFSSSSPDHDFVFGFEASVSVGSHSEEAHHYYFNKKVPKKAKVDMTFEDLCLF